MTYIAGFLTPVPNGNKEAYIESARKAWPLFREYGALQIMETWGDQIPEGKHTDFNRAVALEEGESVCFSWMIWPAPACRPTRAGRTWTCPSMASA